MKKIYLSLLALLCAIHFSYAQTNTFPSSGNVGIGTTTPGTNLGFQNLDTDAGNSGITWYNPSPLSYGIYKTPGAWSVPNYQQLAVGFATGIILNPGVAYPKSYVEVTGGGLRVTSGNVGIGTPNPITKLHVYESSNLNSYLTVANNTIATFFGAGGTSWGIIGTTSNHDFAIYTNEIEKMRITNTGNVGVGTAEPLAMLDVSGNLILRNNQNVTGGGASMVFTNYGNDYQHSPSIRSYLDFAEGVNSQARLVLSSYGLGKNNDELTLMNGNVGIGTKNPDATLAVKGTVHATEVKVDLNVPGPDYVFQPDYKLSTLKEIEAYVEKNHHLPEIPSADQMVKDGLNLGDMNIRLLKKVEELTLYLMEKDSSDQQKDAKLNAQQAQINQLRKQMNTLLKSK
jgi:hypothetical protein